MEKYTGGNRVYRFYCVDSKGVKIEIFNKNSIEKIDDFTKQFEDKDDMLMQLSNQYEINFLDFFIESKMEKQKHNNPGKIIRDIVYKGNVFPDREKLQDLYIDYLLEERQRIKRSFARYKPKFMDDEALNVEPYRLASSVRAKIKDYMKVREVYFELLKHDKVDGKREFDYVKELREDDLMKSLDNFFRMINSINTDFVDKEPEKLTKDDVQDISDGIMIDKIKDGEVEPFEYYDLEDYIRMQSKGRKR